MLFDHSPVHTAGRTGNIGLALIPVFQIDPLGHIGLAQHLDPALLTLQDGMAGAVRVLGAGQSRRKSIILQDLHTGSIHAVKAQVGIINCLDGSAVQGDCRINIIKIDVIQGAAGQLRIKGRRHLSLQIIGIAAGILGIIALMDFHRSDFGQPFLNFLMDGAVNGGDRLQYEKVPLLRGLNQFLRFRQRGSKGLFQDDILTGQQGFFGIAEVGAVDKSDIDRVHIRLCQQLRVVGIDLFDTVFLCQGFSLVRAVGTGKDRFELDRLHMAQGKQRFMYNFTGSDHS